MKIGPAITIAVLSIRLSAFAQTVPANPILWLDASKGVIPENGHIARWLDQSGNGNDVSMSDTLHQPDLTNDSGRPAILFHGWNYLQGPPIFPANHDYTIAVVAKLTDTSAVNNLVSGNIHALYFANNRYPRVVHYWFQYQEVSPVPIWTNGFSAITARYDQAYEQATLDVNGRFADSGWVQATTDSTLYIGSYLGGYFLNGEIEEVLLYNRTLDSNENASLQNYLMSRFEIPEAAALPKPDSTMTSFPTSFQMFPRGMDDSATVPIAGVIYRTGFDSVSLLQLKNEFPVSRATHPLVYHNGNAAFQFSSRIHAEVSEYRFEVHLIHSGFDSIIAECDSIACGDLFMMDGQSNAFKGFDVDTFRNEFCRTLGLRASENLRDTVWHESGGDVGAADQRIQQDLLVNQRLPSSSINEAIGGSPIEMHLPNDSNHYDLRTIYGRTLYRITKMGMASAVHAIFWLQGESNYAPGYYQKFLKLYTSWKEDYPNLQKIYLLQIRPNYCTFGNLDMRDVQRHMEDSISVVEPLAAAALPFQDGCHYYDSGYRFMGDRFYRSLARDFYHAIDTANLRSPNATWAWWTRSDHSQVGIIFSPWDAILRATDDTTVNGIFATLKDYLYPDDTNSHVTSVSFDNDTMFLDLDHPGSTQSIAYLPDQWYNGSDSAVYEGPWIVNQRGLGALLWHRLAIADAPFSSVPDGSPSEHMILIPNPAIGTITVNTTGFRSAITVTILNDVGAIVRQLQFPAGHRDLLTFDLSQEPAGCYLLRLTTESKSEERKFMLER